jgi:hypothetical protein
LWASGLRGATAITFSNADLAEFKSWWRNAVIPRAYKASVLAFDGFDCAWITAASAMSTTMETPGFVLKSNIPDIIIPSFADSTPVGGL